MARSRKSSIELTAYDDLFQTDESRAEAALSKIRDIPISEIDEFPDHPFKVLMDEDMEQLVDSIKRNGVMTPATVRLKEDGRYELISGHRRKKAFVCVRLVIGATIIVGLYLFPVLLEIVRTGLVPPCSDPMTGSSVA